MDSPLPGANGKERKSKEKKETVGEITVPETKTEQSSS